MVKSYKVKGAAEVVAVDGLDFEVAPGESFGLLGPNGAGKSTT
ncbi:MAG: ATP-binding cassette domain-containing protein, partial [Microbacterium sp.]|nr:ATP-binding cassette domain-containing protein [Microbacterium sp.]